MFFEHSSRRARIALVMTVLSILLITALIGAGCSGPPEQAGEQQEGGTETESSSEETGSSEEGGSEGTTASSGSTSGQAAAPSIPAGSMGFLDNWQHPVNLKVLVDHFSVLDFSWTSGAGYGADIWYQYKGQETVAGVQAHKAFFSIYTYDEDSESDANITVWMAPDGSYLKAKKTNAITMSSQELDNPDASLLEAVWEPFSRAMEYKIDDVLAGGTNDSWSIEELDIWEDDFEGFILTLHSFDVEFDNSPKAPSGVYRNFEWVFGDYGSFEMLTDWYTYEAADEDDYFSYYVNEWSLRTDELETSGTDTSGSETASGVAAGSGGGSFEVGASNLGLTDWLDLNEFQDIVTRFNKLSLTWTSAESSHGFKASVDYENIGPKTVDGQEVQRFQLDYSYGSLGADGSWEPKIDQFEVWFTGETAEEISTVQITRNGENEDWSMSSLNAELGYIWRPFFMANSAHWAEKTLGEGSHLGSAEVTEVYQRDFGSTTAPVAKVKVIEDIWSPAHEYDWEIADFGDFEMLIGWETISSNDGGADDMTYEVTELELK